MKNLFLLVLASIYLHAAPRGEMLFNGNCITCHALENSPSAPSVKEIHTRYKKAFDSKEQFVNAMARWIIKPDAKTALMPEAVKKYGLMPELGYDKETLNEIASYLYDLRLNP